MEPAKANYLLADFFTPAYKSYYLYSVQMVVVSAQTIFGNHNTLVFAGSYVLTK